MTNLKPILLVFALLVLLALVCSIGGSGLLNNTSHVITAQSNLEAWKTTRYMAGTIDRQATSLVIAMVVMAVVLLGILAIAGRSFFLLQRAPDPSQRVDRPGQPKFLSLGPDARARIRRMSPAQQRALLEQLYTVCAWLERDLGDRPEKQLPVYEKKDSLINWG